YADITLDPAEHKTMQRDAEVDLTLKEFMVLRYLMENKGKAVSRQRLGEMLYGWDVEIGSNALEVHIHNLRKKLGQQLIRTVRGLGYKLG
ncbi:MAG TPA: winged helix family transcriptional regulator, partial [Thiolapillus brandeum]|nr:winged helix family transcriptional regulator [Thiolapillus brandeum]